MMNDIAIHFANAPLAGSVMVRDGKLRALHVSGAAVVKGNAFELPVAARLDLSLAESRCHRGAFPTLIRIDSATAPFAFYARDVSSAHPIWIPEYGVAVAPADDSRDYAAIVADIRERGMISDFTRFAGEAEESYENAACRNRKQYCPTWLGIGRDMRLFRVGYRENFCFWGEIQPAFHSTSQHLPEVANSAYKIRFALGQGATCRPRITRRLEDGVLPILHSTQTEQDLLYRLTVFVTLEKRPLRPGIELRGSEWLACYANTGGNMLSAAELDAAAGLIASETRGREEELICCLRVTAVNTGRVPRYAWLVAPVLHFNNPKAACVTPAEQRFNSGFSSLKNSGRVFGVNRIDGRPMRDPEMAVLVQPGESLDFDMLLPHSPLAPERARILMDMDINAHLEGCRAFWNARLASAAEIRIPEKTIDEAVRAGLLHCDLATLGREPRGPALATIGWYSPIGTESAPIIQYYDSMGWHDLAERCIQFFFERQRSDGFIQNFARYESETGPLLWTAGEHFRYTRDTDWLRRVAPNIKRAADYLLRWRRRNCNDEQRRAGGYGMLDGKVADPDDFYHSFFLNAGTYLGLKRTAEMLRGIDPGYARMLAGELPGYKEDIRAGFHDAQARAPVIPLGDGSWAPVVPPWVEHTGAITFYADGGCWFSHGSLAGRSNLTGPLWLIIGEILDPRETGAELLVKANQYPITLENAAISQPYYARHDYAHLRRGEIFAFLKAYYNQLTALHDRETYTFWEHYYHASQHKTHEEAWFLMQTRWMLWFENGSELHLLSAVPRSWLAHGCEIGVRNVKSYFGALSFHARSDLQRNRITADIAMDGNGTPLQTVRLRLPHPQHCRARSCEGGEYDPERESVLLNPQDRQWRVSLQF